jgi:putative ABC transport system ATP-binding protein
VSEPMVSVEGVSKSFGSGTTQVEALSSVDLLVPRGQLVAVTGPSGSGKTTLLHCLGGLEQPDQGRVRVDGVEVTSLDERGRLALRQDTVGYVFQSFALLPALTTRENVGVPLRLQRLDVAEREQRVEQLLGLVGLGERMEQRPTELSGGEQQRVAIARALAARPTVLLADEPTGQLDSATGKSVMELLSTLVHRDGVTAIVATHDDAIMEVADEVYLLHDGRIQEHRVASA